MTKSLRGKNLLNNSQENFDKTKGVAEKRLINFKHRKEEVLRLLLFPQNQELRYLQKHCRSKQSLRKTILNSKTFNKEQKREQTN